MRGPIESGCTCSSHRLAVGPRGQQRPAIMDEALKAVRSHVKGRDIKRVFVPGRCFLALHLKDLVDLTLDFGQVRLAPLPIRMRRPRA